MLFYWNKYSLNRVLNAASVWFLAVRFSRLAFSV